MFRATHLRCSPADGGEERVSRPHVPPGRKTEIDQHGDVGVGQHDVGRFDIVVRDAPLVEVAYRGSKLTKVDLGLIWRETDGNETLKIRHDDAGHEL